MWTRAELKQKGKFAFKRNYWRTVLVSFIVAILIGSASSSSSGFSSGFTSGLESGMEEKSYNSDYKDDYYDNYYEDEYYYEGEKEGAIGMAAAAVFIIVFLVVFLVVFTILVILDIFLFNPLEVGARRYFYLNLNQPAEVKELAYAFDHSYKNVIKVMFFRDLYVFLWSLLFIIPGIVKSYQYRMIPYLLAENPAMSMEEAFATSKRMMDGEKWKTFVLDLSFILWIILSIVPFVGMFYVDSYINMTDAALYERLKYNKGVNVYGWSPYGQNSSIYGQNPSIYGQNPTLQR